MIYGYLSMLHIIPHLFLHHFYALVVDGYLVTTACNFMFLTKNIRMASLIVFSALQGISDILSSMYVLKRSTLFCLFVKMFYRVYF